MKRFGKVLLAAIAAIVLLAGCTMKENFAFKINKDKKVQVAFTMAYDKEFIDGLISMDGDTKKEDITDEMRWESLKDMEKDIPEGYTLTKVTDEGWYGYVATKEIGSIDELSTEDLNAERVSLTSDTLEDKKLFIKDGNKYKSNMKIDKSSEDYKSMESYKSYGAVFDISLSVELPTKAISNNASEVTNDGKTLKWNLLDTEDINFEFEFKKSSNLIVIIAVVAVIVLLLIVIIIIVVVVATKKPSAPAAPVEQTEKK